MSQLLSWLCLLVVIVFGAKKNCSSTINCWSDWSPCTVTCKDIDATTNFALRWRRWECNHCKNITQPNQLTEFIDCDFKVPYCLWREKNLKAISTRTVTRVVALSIAIFIISVPTTVICCLYTPGHPLVCFCCQRRRLVEV